MSYCPTGHFARNSDMTCQKCHEKCAECNGPTETACIACQRPTSFLKPSTNECVARCTDGFYLSKFHSKANIVLLYFILDKQRKFKVLFKHRFFLKSLQRSLRHFMPKKCKWSPLCKQ